MFEIIATPQDLVVKTERDRTGGGLGRLSGLLLSLFVPYTCCSGCCSSERSGCWTCARPFGDTGEPYRLWPQVAPVEGWRPALQVLLSQGLLGTEATQGLGGQ